jgi:hypothetical protein
MFEDKNSKIKKQSKKVACTALQRRRTPEPEPTTHTQQ